VWRVTKVSTTPTQTQVSAQGIAALSLRIASQVDKGKLLVVIKLEEQW
jgi:hypothetical protein